jgi:hypothetical protein
MKAEPPPTRGVNRDSGTASANGGWLRRLVRPCVPHISLIQCLAAPIRNRPAACLRECATACLRKRPATCLSECPTACGLECGRATVFMVSATAHNQAGE